MPDERWGPWEDRPGDDQADAESVAEARERDRQRRRRRTRIRAAEDADLRGTSTSTRDRVVHGIGEIAQAARSLGEGAGRVLPFGGGESARSGCLAMLALLTGVVIAAWVGLQLLAGLFAGSGGDVRDAASTPGQAVDGEVVAPPAQSDIDDPPFVPRDGVYEIENMPFLPACGPGDLGSGFEEGTIEVAEDGRSLTATGSSPGTASFEMQLVDQTPDRLTYVGIESFTGIELTFVFTSPTTLEANVRATGDVCIERPAVGEWDREVGEPDPDAPPDVELPAWAPPAFPAGDTRTVDVDEGDGGTFTVVFEDTHPTDVLFILDEWADDNGHVVASFAPGQPEDDPDDGSLAYTAVVELSDGRIMDVEIVDIGNFDTRLTATVRSV